MPLVFAAITPHPPLLIPGIAKDKIEAVKKTKAAMEKLEEALYISKPHTIIIVSPHSGLYPDAFSLNGHERFVATFEEFGDMVTTKQWTGNPTMAAKISHLAKKNLLPVQLMSEAKLDHGASVPLYYLTDHLPDVSILPAGYSNLPAHKHTEFGALLKEAIFETNQRVAVIASGDLSHLKDQETPPSLDAPAHPFDAKLRLALEQDQIEEIINLDTAVALQVDECGYRSILILLGAIRNISHRFETYSYERPFGVGYLVGNFHL